MNDSIRDLARNMIRRREGGDPPYTLFLGSTAWLSPGGTRSKSAGLTSISIPGEYVAREPDSDAGRTEAFFAYLNDVDNEMREDILIHLLKAAAPSAGHRHLANLVINGYFRVIANSGLDSSIEQAILNAGLWSSDLIVLCLSPEDAPERRRREAVHLVKIHGDPFAWDIWETWNELRCSYDTRRFLHEALGDNVIMVGYHPRDAIVDPLLASGSGDIVYVNAAQPGIDFPLPEDINGRIEMSIDGEFGTLDGFFGTLADLLLYRRDSPVQTSSAGDLESMADAGETANGELSLDNDTERLESLRSQLGALEENYYRLQKQAAMYGKAGIPRLLTNQLLATRNEMEALQAEIADLEDQGV